MPQKPKSRSETSLLRGKKIRDIFPPPTTFPKEKAASLLVLNKKKRWQKVMGGVLISLTIIGLFCHFALSKAEVIIWPKTEILNFREKVTLSSEVSQLNLGRKVIPGKIFEEEKSLSQEFPSSGKTLKEEKARGVIRLYNAYTTNSETWKAGTRFMSADGKLFLSKTRISVPGAKLKNRKLDPSYVDVEVIAAEAGADYNIPPTTFVVYIFRGTPKYTKYWGKSFEPMEGGFKGEVPQVTQGDLQRAKNILLEVLKKEGKDSLKKKIPSDFVLLDEAISQELIAADSSVKVGAEVESFNFQVKIKSKGLGWKSSDLENFAKEWIKKNIPQEMSLQEGSLELNFSPESIDLNRDKIVLNLEIKAMIFADIELTSLKKELSGKSLEEIQLFLEKNPKITKVQIKFFPIWLKKAPENVEKVEIKLNLTPTP